MHTKHIKFNRYKIPLSGLLAIGGIFLFSYLTFTPTPVHAETETRTLSDISTMQEITQQICINSRDEETNTLRDTRDNKIYYVTKLKDGNCWMTQNLAYNGGGTQQCAVNGTICSGWPSAGAPSIYAVGSHTNSSHASMGNYYSFDAANTGGSTDGDTNSVCPAGWQLPTANNGDTDKSFEHLLRQYNWISTSTKPSQIGSKGITDSPLYFQYSGHLSNGSLHNPDSIGRYWSSTPNGADRGYNFYFDDSNIYPSNGSNGYRYLGLSVRCLAEGGWLLDDNQANIAITVSPVISIDVTQHVDTDVDFTRIAKSNIIARVGSNQPYQVLFSTNQSTLEQSPSVNNQNIPMITQDQTITAGISKWGIKKLSSSADAETNDNTIYSPVGIGENKALFYTSNTATSEILTFPVAIAVSPQLPQGTYSTQITLTAVAI